MTYEVAYRVFHMPGYPGLAYTIVAAYVNLLSLWSIGKVAGEVNAIQPVIARLLGGDGHDREPPPFQLMGSVAGPLLLTLGGTLAFQITDYYRYPGAAPIVLAPFLYVGFLPANAGVWNAAALFAGLDRLGRRHLRLAPFQEDKSLGLRPLGQVAFFTFLLFVAGFLPLMVVAAKDVRSTITVLVEFSIGVTLFFLSMYRLHRQLVTAKAGHLARARALYCEAFQPLETRWSLEMLTAQAAQLSAAEAMERRAAAIQEWPFDEGVLARVAAVVTSAVAITLARLALSWFGLKGGE